MEWTDKAILLTVAKAGKDALALEILTRLHGRYRCYAQIDKQKIPMLLPGSFLDLTFIPGAPGKPGQAELNEADGGIIAETADDIALLVLSCAKDTMAGFLSIGEPAKEVFATFETLMTSLIAEDGRWPLHYANWEFALLSNLGHVQRMRECRPAYRHGDMIYMAPGKGRLYPREQVGAFIDRMLPVPGFLMGARNGSVVEVRQALELTTLLFRKFALPDAKAGGLPRARKNVLEAIAEMSAIPAAPRNKGPVVDLEMRRKRLLTLRPLMISNITYASNP